MIKSKVDGKKTMQKDEQSEAINGKLSNSTQAPTSHSNIVIPPNFPAALKKAKID